MARNPASSYEYEAYIRASADEVWRGITDGKQTAQYFYGSPVKSSLKAGGEFLYMTPDGSGKMAEGTIAAIEPKRRLVLENYRLLYHPGVAEDKPSRESWEVTAMGAMCKVVVVHDQLTPDGPTYKDVSSGIPLIVSSLKSLLETGTALPMQQDGQ
ncbi:MAG: SRPBCC domain-containing protein [Candidatus Dormibacteraceae bacterium]